MFFMFIGQKHIITVEVERSFMLKIKIRDWFVLIIKRYLGIDKTETRTSELERVYYNLAAIGIDVNIKGQSAIIVMSKINGGQVRFIDTHFESLAELEALVEDLNYRYCSHNNLVIDAPLDVTRHLQNCTWKHDSYCLVS